MFTSPHQGPFFIASRWEPPLILFESRSCPRRNRAHPVSGVSKLPGKRMNSTLAVLSHNFFGIDERPKSTLPYNPRGNRLSTLKLDCRYITFGGTAPRLNHRRRSRLCDLKGRLLPDAFKAASSSQPHASVRSRLFTDNYANSGLLMGKS